METVGAACGLLVLVAAAACYLASAPGLRVSNRMKPYGQSRDADRSSSIPPVTSSILQQSARLEPKVPENSEDPFSLCPRLRDAGAGAPGLCRKPAAAAER